MIQYLLNHHEVFDTGYDLHSPFALFAFPDIDAEHPLESSGASGWLSDAPG